MYPRLKVEMVDGLGIFVLLDSWSTKRVRPQHKIMYPRLKGEMVDGVGIFCMQQSLPILRERSVFDLSHTVNVLFLFPPGNL
jgi:hypothetical protein